MSIEEIKEQQVVETPVEETPSAEITPVENEIEEETGEEQEVEETQEEKAKRDLPENVFNELYLAEPADDKTNRTFTCRKRIIFRQVNC